MAFIIQKMQRRLPDIKLRHSNFAGSFKEHGGKKLFRSVHCLSSTAELIHARSGYIVNYSVSDGIPKHTPLKSDVDKYLELSLLKSEQYCSVLLQTG